MQLFHTSPTEITAITTSGRFGSFLFFSACEYVMTAGSHVTYSVEVDEEAIIKADRLFYHDDAAKLDELVAELAERLSVDPETAEALIEESRQVYDLDHIDPEDLADASWDVQRFSARAAQLLGYRGVAVTDEQGTAYLIDMHGKEQELVKQ
ncbi:MULTISPECIES: hypothetical protein [unclassified Pseudomonas]|uniref:hypothetical protein n=1 Tax=unclassified Pseudomonas TaxID=196821 RepID=UPI002448B2EA|nr:MULTISPECIES: hypothetical protein [unclassified Pseudomonas]MDG9928552.1 hypothetical protein [Pseudomonas sp. GD04042]MDH0482722.1 hypothetical protein [Pseudomonas sp. GD04015]MDH0604576.1 hypothetical protein [Pseudomonas sp. GD03869]